MQHLNLQDEIQNTIKKSLQSQGKNIEEHQVHNLLLGQSQSETEDCDTTLQAVNLAQLDEETLCKQFRIDTALLQQQFGEIFKDISKGVLFSKYSLPVKVEGQIPGEIPSQIDSQIPDNISEILF